MQRYTITLPGARTVAGRLSGRGVGDLMRALSDGAAGALRLRVEGRSSTRPDRLPAWLEQGADFALLEVTEGEPRIVIGAPSLGEAVPRRFDQQDLFSPIDPNQSVLKPLIDCLTEALRGNADSDAFDPDLLGVLSRDFTRVFSRAHAEGLTLQNGSRTAEPIQLDRGSLRALGELHERTPKSRRVRVAGQIDVIRYTTSTFLMNVADGSRIRGALVDADPEQLRPLYGKVAVVEGMAQFRPSGSLLRIDVDQISAGADRDVAVFGVEPRPLRVVAEQPRVQRRQNLKSGINAVIGTWPGDETDDEVEQYLRDIS